MIAKFCVDCEHHEFTQMTTGPVKGGPGYHFCRRPIRQERRTDLVTGETILGPNAVNRQCADERAMYLTRVGDPCGPEGKYFSKKA